jgi:hypothetical protein
MITDIQQFQEKWIIWWASCQAKWRVTEKWPYPHEDADGKDWARLNITGPSGLFAIVVSTSWWAASVESDSQGEVFSAAVKDLHWAINSLIHFNSRLQVTGGECNTAQQSTLLAMVSEVQESARSSLPPRLCQGHHPLVEDKTIKWARQAVA